MAQDDGSPSGGFDFHGRQYSRFNSDLAAEIRHEVYGEDNGQPGWRTAAEQGRDRRSLARSATPWRALLQREEGAAWFDQRHQFLAITAELAGSRRLSRFLYLAEKRPPPK